MGRITHYEHHGKLVAVDLRRKGKHREHCLCFRCSKFKPDTTENCDIAEQLFRGCKLNGTVTPVYECPEWRPIARQKRLDEGE